MEGWIKVHRSIMDNWLWQEKTYSRLQAWLEIIMLANHTGKKARLGNEFVYVERGSLITSELKLSSRWGWSKTKVRSFLTMLENDKMIEKKTDRKKTTITVVNYDIYQDLKTTEEPQKNLQETTEEPQKNTNKNVKNDKNVRMKEGKDTTSSGTSAEREAKYPYKAIIDYLNTAADKSYRCSSKDTRKSIKSRMDEGFTFDDFCKVIDTKVAEWGREPQNGEKDMRPFIRPCTLFGAKFESYLNQGPPKHGGTAREDEWEGFMNDCRQI